MQVTCPLETFPALAALPVLHGFTGRVPGLDVKTDRATALQRLDRFHDAARSAMGAADHAYRIAEQVHGAASVIVDATSPFRSPEVDALITADPSVCLGIYVADCGPVFIVDPKRRVIAGAHSGRKGTEQNIVGATIARMQSAFGCRPDDMVVQLGPCIRPPNYEIDFASEILRQARKAGVGAVYDCETCTGSSLDRYYSYRMEKGQTGRMVALLALA